MDITKLIYFKAVSIYYLIIYCIVQVQCRLIGGHLAMITSKEENTFIRGYAVRHQCTLYCIIILANSMEGTQIMRYTICGHVLRTKIFNKKKIRITNECKKRHYIII